jgi:transposase
MYGIMAWGGPVMSKRRKRYSSEFKIEAVRLWETTDKTVVEIERELGIGHGCLTRWKQKYMSEGESAFAGRGRVSAEGDDLQQVKRELEIVRQERDILKKAVAIFSHPRG